MTTPARGGLPGASSQTRGDTATGIVPPRKRARGKHGRGLDGRYMDDKGTKRLRAAPAGGLDDEAIARRLQVRVLNGRMHACSRRDTNIHRCRKKLTETWQASCCSRKPPIESLRCVYCARRKKSMTRPCSDNEPRQQIGLWRFG